MKLGLLAEKIQGRLVGNSDQIISSIATLADAEENDISFLSDSKYTDLLTKSRAAAFIVAADFSGVCDKALLFVDDVNVAVETLLEIFAPDGDNICVGIDPDAKVAPTARLAEGVAIGANVIISDGVIIEAGTKILPGCFIGRDVKIGGNCFIWPNVVIKHNCTIGNNVIINANSTIGTDGFGFRLVNGKHQRICHIGTVEIQDNVEIGANCAIDRAKFGKTIIGAGTKIDNFVMVAHNVKIGENCILVAQVGIAGSTQIGNYVVFAGGAGAVDHIKIGDGAMLGVRAVAIGDIAPGQKVMGMPARDIKDYFREIAALKKLPQLQKDFRNLRKQMD